MSVTFRRAAMGFLIACALLMALPTSWLIEPERMFITTRPGGAAVMELEHAAPFPVYLRWRAALVPQAGKDRFCENGGQDWFLPHDSDAEREAAWRVDCRDAPPDGDYRIHARWNLCVLRLCARPQRFVSEAFVLPQAIQESRRGRFVARG